MKRAAAAGALAALALAGGGLALAMPDAAITTASHAEYRQEVQMLTARCAFCHGVEGVSGYAIWPSLAGLDADYLERQLAAYALGAEGPRASAHSGQMYAIAASLDEGQRRAVAEYYAAMPPPRWDGAGRDGPGRDLYARGEAAVLACATCHGADAGGQAALNAPRLGGQPARYTLDQLNAYASGSREDAGSGMAAIAAAMTDEQKSAIASFLAP